MMNSVYKLEMKSQRIKLDWIMTEDANFFIKQSPEQCRVGVEACPEALRAADTHVSKHFPAGTMSNSSRPTLAAM